MVEVVVTHQDGVQRLLVLCAQPALVEVVALHDLGDVAGESQIKANRSHRRDQEKHGVPFAQVVEGQRGLGPESAHDQLGLFEAVKGLDR